MILNEKQSYAFNRFVEGRNLFITGSGGKGKSVIVNYIQEHFEESTIFLAPTGVAAQNINGSTIHRAFKFGFGYLGKAQRAHVAEKCQELFSCNSIKRIVIDEISMVRADLFAAIDMNLRKIKKVNRAFGGLQIVGVGDFFQLSPVLNKNNTEGQLFLKEFKSPFAFESSSWTDAGFEMIELEKVMRQTDVDMINALNSIRQKDSNFSKSLKFLNDVGMSNDAGDDPLFLCSTNANADTINHDYYENVEGEERVYIGKTTGVMKDLVVPQELRLKVGVKVLICGNNADADYYNGQTGYVALMTPDVIYVQLADGTQVGVTKFKWEEADYTVNGDSHTRNIIGTYLQFPIRIGYAVTIHKSQGMSLDQAVIYTGGGLFAHGQGYVALSRLRSLEGLSLIKPIRESEIIVDQRVKDFYDNKVVVNLLG